jgi:phenylpyruvate tautomerase PptA (4-oxalocrotonate tautomerase family)
MPRISLATQITSGSLAATTSLSSRSPGTKGRATEQKKQLYKTIAEGLAKAVSIRIEDVFVTLVDVKRENWSFGMDVAQYAT